MATTVSQVNSSTVNSTGGTRATVRNGDTGPNVSRLQELLKAQGFYTGNVDGKFGAGTQTAVSAFQSSKGVKADGVVGPQTWALLEAGGGQVQPPPPSTGSTRTLRVGDEGADVRELQGLLKAKGFLTGNADGKYGDGTRAAVAAFQERNGLRADGSVGPMTWEKLRSSNTVGPGPTGEDRPVDAMDFNSLNNSRIDTDLGSRGPGWVTYNRDGNDQFGTPRTVARLKAVFAEWNRRHPDSPMSVGDMSRRGGGHFPPHSTHQNGKQVDLRPQNRGGDNTPMTWQSGQYSREKTREFMKLVKQMVPGTRFLFNDPKLIAEGLSSRAGGHDNHLHLMFP